MRKSLASAAVVCATVAGGCGGQDGAVEGETANHQLRDVACAGCDVRANGTFTIGDEVERFKVKTTTGSGPGFGGVGTAATGTVTMRGPFFFTGVVDTLVACDETGVRHARLEGPITSGGGGRFTVNVFDGRGIAPDQFWLFADYATKPRDRFVEQNVRGVHVGEPNRCEG